MAPGAAWGTHSRVIALRLAPPVRERNVGAALKTAGQHRDHFQAALADDLNLPMALSTLWAVVKDANLDAATKLALIEEFDQALGLSLLEA